MCGPLPFCVREHNVPFSPPFSGWETGVCHIQIVKLTEMGKIMVKDCTASVPTDAELEQLARQALAKSLKGGGIISSSVGSRQITLTGPGQLNDLISDLSYINNAGGVIGHVLDMEQGS